MISSFAGEFGNTPLTSDGWLTSDLLPVTRFGYFINGEKLAMAKATGWHTSQALIKDGPSMRFDNDPWCKKARTWASAWVEENRPEWVLSAFARQMQV